MSFLHCCDVVDSETGKASGLQKNRHPVFKILLEAQGLRLPQIILRNFENLDYATFVCKDSLLEQMVEKLGNRLILVYDDVGDD